MAKVKLFLDVDQGTLLAGINNPVPALMPRFVQGDNPTVELHLVSTAIGTQSAPAPEIPFAEGATIRIALGTPGQTPAALNTLSIDMGGGLGRSGIFDLTADEVGTLLGAATMVTTTLEIEETTGSSVSTPLIIPASLYKQLIVNGGSGPIVIPTAATLEDLAAETAAREAEDAKTATVSIKAFGATTGSSDCATEIQAAIDHAAAAGLVLVSGAGTYTVGSTLTVPSNLIWVGAGTVIKLKNGANVPLLKNKTYGFTEGTYTNQNIRIEGVEFDGNALNQAATDSTGAWLMCVAFAGVKNLYLDITTTFAARFALTACNCTHVRGRLVFNINPDTSIALNHDGLHMFGKNSDWVLDSVIINNGQDDVVAINADDDADLVGNVSGGGTIWTNAHCNGPTRDISIGQIVMNGCNNGIRLLSNASAISNVRIGSLTGSCKTSAVVIGPWGGMGTASCWQGIWFGNIDVGHPEGEDDPFIVVDCSTNGVPVSDIRFDRLRHKAPGGSWDPYFRQTMVYTNQNSRVSVGDLILDGTSSSLCIETGNSANGSLEIERVLRVNSAPFTPLSRSSHLVGVVHGSIGEIRIGEIVADHLANVVLAYNVGGASIDEITAYIPKAATFDAGVKPMHNGNSMLIGRCELTGPNVPMTLDDRWEFTSGSTAANIAVDLPEYASSTTMGRPPSPTLGYRIFDTTLGKPIWWNGAAWKDAAGAAV